MEPPRSPDSVTTQVRPTGRGWVRALVNDQRVAYLIIGGLNTAISLTCFFLIHVLAGDRISYMVTLLCSYAVGTLSGFMLQRRFVFRVTGNVLADLTRFTIVNSGGLAINSLLLPLFVEVAGLAVAPAQLLATALTVIATYLGHRFFSFRRV